MDSLNSEFNLLDQEVKDFQSRGFALLKNVATREEIEYYRPLINEAVKKLNPEKRRMEDRDTYGKAFLQTMNLWEFDEQVRDFTLAKKIWLGCSTTHGCGACAALSRSGII